VHRFTGATLDDAGRLETAINTALGASGAKSGGGVGKKIAIGCGGLIGLVVVVIVIVAIAGAAGNKSKGSGNAASGKTKANVGPYAVGGVATSKELQITLNVVTDPYTSGNQFSQPSSGNRFILIHATAKDVDSREHTVNEFSFHLKTADSHVYNPDFVVTSGQQFRATALRAGEVTEG